MTIILNSDIILNESYKLTVESKKLFHLDLISIGWIYSRESYTIVRKEISRLFAIVAKYVQKFSTSMLFLLVLLLLMLLEIYFYFPRIKNRTNKKREQKKFIGLNNFSSSFFDT
jgi:hypothetical protein